MISNAAITQTINSIRYYHSTLHSTLVSQSPRQTKYLQLFSSTGRGKPGPKGPNNELIKAIIEIKQRNTNFGCPRIAFIISNTFGIEINTDVVRIVLMKHYHPSPEDRGGPSWLSFIANTKDVSEYWVTRVLMPSQYSIE